MQLNSGEGWEKVTLSTHRPPLKLLLYGVGRTIPSLTQAIREETERLRRVAERIRDQKLREKLLKALEHSRELQDAFYDELADPQEIVLLTLILYMCGRHD